MDFLAQITAQLQAGNVKSELEALCKDRDINVRLKVDDNNLQNALNSTIRANGLSKTGSKIGNQIGQNIGRNISRGVKSTANGKSITDTIFKASDLKNNAYMTKVSNTIDKQMAEIQKMANAKGWKDFQVTGSEMADGYIKNLKLMVTEANGTVKELNFIRGKIEGQSKGKTKNRNSLIQTDDVKIIKTSRQAEIDRLNADAKQGQKEIENQHKQNIANQKALNREREKGKKQAEKIASDRAKEEQKVDERWQKAMRQQERRQKEEREANEYSQVLMDAYDEADQNVAREKAEREAVERERRIGQEQAREIARQYQEEQQLIDQMENMRLQSEESSRRREQQMNDSQVSAMNKAQEQDYKERQKQEEKQMKESVDAINRSNKEKEKAYQQEQKTRKDNADYLIKEAFSTYDKIAQAESNALKSNASGNTELEKYYNDQVSAHRLYMTQLKTELKQYSDIYDDDSINNILGNKEKESKSVVEKTVAQLLDKDNADITKASAELDRKLASYTSDFTDGSLSSSLKQMNNAFNEIKRFKLDDEDNVQVKSIEEADKALSDFRKAYIDLQNHFNGSKILDDSTLLSTFEKLEISSAKFKNSMSEVKIDVQPFLQVEQALEKVAIARERLDSITDVVSISGSDEYQKKYGDTKSYQQLISYIKQAKQAQAELDAEQSKSNPNLDVIKTKLKEITSATTKAENQMKRLEQPIGEMDKATASNKTLAWLTDNTKAAKKFGDQLRELSDLQLEASTWGELDNLNKKFKEITSQAKQLGLTGKTLFGNIRESFTNIATFTGVYGFLQNVVEEIPRQALSSVIEVDDAMTNLRMATSATNEEAKDLMKTYSEMGKELKTLGTDVASSATEWLKQGKSIEEASILAKDSIVLSKIGDMSSEDATKTITAAMKSYNLSSSEVMNFVDQISNIDMASATDVGGLSDAFNEVAANARIAGVETEKLLSYAAVIGETSQEGMSGVGTALNAIFSRMGNIKLSRLKDYDTGEDLSNVETVLRKNGIALRDAQGQFRDFDNVLAETAKSWKSYSSVTQRAIANAFAGTHHANDFYILMEQFAQAEEYMTIATSNYGSSMEKFSAYQDSATGKIEGFKNAFQSLSNTFIDSDMFKGIIDVGTEVLNLLENIIDVGGGIPLTLGAIGGISLFKNLDWVYYKNWSLHTKGYNENGIINNCVL